MAKQILCSCITKYLKEKKIIRFKYFKLLRHIMSSHTLDIEILMLNNILDPFHVSIKIALLKKIFYFFNLI